MSIKKLISFFIFVNIAIFSYAQTEDLDKKLDYLSLIITQCSASYDEEVEKGFDVQKTIEKIKNEYLTLNKSNAYDEELLAKIIFEKIEEDSNINNLHFAVTTSKQNFVPAFFKWRASDTYFEKKGENYYVIYSDIRKVKKGQKYTGNIDNLFKCIFKGKEAYCFGIFSEEIVKETVISIDNIDFPVKIYFDSLVDTKHAYINSVNTKNTFYLAIGDCTFAASDIMKFNELQVTLKSLLNKMNSNNYENVILDLRSNTGGYYENVEPFIYSLYCKNNFAKQSNLKKVMKDFTAGEKCLYSPAFADSYLKFINENKALIPTGLDFAKQLKKEMDENPRRYYEVYGKTDISASVVYEDSLYNGKLIILTNKHTGSAAEKLILMSYIANPENIIVVGTNTMGALDYGGVFSYKLPDSNITIGLTNIEQKNMPFMKYNSHWKGDKYGFFPDYWTESFDLLNTIEYITTDKEIKKTLKGLRKGLK